MQMETLSQLLLDFYQPFTNFTNEAWHEMTDDLSLPMYDNWAVEKQADIS